MFQRDKPRGPVGTYHFTFTGKESRKAAVIICNKSLQVLDGHVWTGDFHLIADSQTWLGFLAKERNLFWAILRCEIRIKGTIKLLKVFARCFPT